MLVVVVFGDRVMVPAIQCTTQSRSKSDDLVSWETRSTHSQLYRIQMDFGCETRGGIIMIQGRHRRILIEITTRVSSVQEICAF